MKPFAPKAFLDIAQASAGARSGKLICPQHDLFHSFPRPFYPISTRRRTSRSFWAFGIPFWASLRLRFADFCDRPFESPNFRSEALSQLAGNMYELTTILELGVGFDSREHSAQS